MGEKSFENNEAISNFRQYLRIASVQPDINYDTCVNFLKSQAAGLGLPFNVYDVSNKKPVVVITWEGSEKHYPSVLLNSHMDVVPVFEDKWTHKPFSADIDEKGNIYARGSQDMKCVGIQYLEAIRNLKKANVVLRRTVHLCFVPDEEIGGSDGMQKFVLTDHFKALNVGFALDEGMANPEEDYDLFYGERSIWHVHVHCPGTTGHGSLLLPDTAGEKANVVLNKFMEYRACEKKRLEDNPTLTVGDITTINVTSMRGGVQDNVVPDELVIGFDIRIAVTVDMVEFEALLNRWCTEAGAGVYLEFAQKGPQIEVTTLDDSNPWWVAFKKAADDLKLKLNQRIFPGGTDSRYIRQLGLPAIGFSPMNNTPVLLHDHDEYLNADIFLKGIKIYEKLITAVGNVVDRTG